MLFGCAKHPQEIARSPSVTATTQWTYDVHAAGPNADALTVVADFAPGASDSLMIDDESVPYVRDVRVQTASGFRAVPRLPSGWSAPCHAGCRIQYSFALGEAAAKTNDVDTAIRAGGIIVAPPSTWLIRPGPDTGEGRYRFAVHTEDGAGYASGVLPAADGAKDTFEANTWELDAASFSAFGPFHLERIRSGASEVDVAIAPHGLAIDSASAATWIGRAVDGLAKYYGTFPVRRTLAIVLPGPQGNVEGLTLGDGGPAVVLAAGPAFTGAAWRDDWVATHELLHVTLPSLSREHSWLSEGIATYVEPIVRARAGIVSPTRFWGDLIKGLPNGLPESGDEGLEQTHTWGRTYWGGALFCLLADVRIREATGGRHSFDDALRGIVATGANVESHWEIRQFLAVGDRSTGTAVLADLYREMGLAPGLKDLTSLWARLGVRMQGNEVTFDEGAPLAALRRDITNPRAKN